MAEYERRLYRLGELDKYEVADDDPDVRGWEVISGDNKTLGKVEELIVDTDQMRVRYLDIKVRDEITGTENQHMLLPIGMASIDEKKDVIRADSVETVTVLKYPKFEGGIITRDFENSLRKSINPQYESMGDDADYYENQYFDDERFYSSRRKKRLARLRELRGYEIKEVDPDIRDWEVVSRDGERIGKVYEIVVDPKAKKIRYIEVRSEIDRGSADDESHLLIPVGLASLDNGKDRVVVRMDYTELTRYPVYRGGEISRSYEDSLRNSIRLDSLTARDPDDEYYSHEYYNDQGFYGRRGSGVRWI